MRIQKNLKMKREFRELEFLHGDNKDVIQLSEKNLNYLKQLSKKKIDEKCFQRIIDEIKSNKLEFKLSPQENNYIKNLKEDDILDYVIYRYKFTQYPKNKIDLDFPLYILIEAASSCNLRCTMCFQTDKSFRKKKYMGLMDPKIFKKVIDEASQKGTKAITFGSRGEPSIHPKIGEFLAYTKDKFLETKFITNATKLNDDLIHSIFRSNVHMVNFSIDSEDSKTYEKIRKFSEFDNVLKNVKRYNKIKKEYKNCKTVTRISGVKVLKEQNARKFSNFWKQYADEVIFKNAFERWDTYNNSVIEDNSLPCRVIWERMYVWYDGKVNPCDTDYKSLLSYGNVNNNTISEIWNSPEYSKLKKTHLDNNRNKLIPCDRCSIS